MRTLSAARMVTLAAKAGAYAAWSISGRVHGFKQFGFGAPVVHTGSRQKQSVQQYWLSVFGQQME